MYLAVLEVMFYIKEMERSLEKPLEKWDSGRNFSSKLSFSLRSGRFPSLSLFPVCGRSFSTGIPKCMIPWSTNIGASCWGVVCVLSYVWLCDPMDCSPSGCSVHGISQARILEWVAISLSRGSSPPKDQTHISCIAGRFFTIWATTEAHRSRAVGFILVLSKQRFAILGMNMR